MVGESWDPLDDFVSWAVRERGIVAVTLFGSRARGAVDGNTADRWSDVDLHVTAVRPAEFLTRDWALRAFKADIAAYAHRDASGGVKKVTIVFFGGQIVDVVVVPASRMRFGRLLVKFGLHRGSPMLRAAFSEMATVMRHGFRVLKGGRAWEKYYARVVSDIPGARLADNDIETLANEFVCDLVSFRNKLARGELIAAQRVLHRALAETNFRLMHEIRLRRNARSFREARRAEHLLAPMERDLIAVDAHLDAASLSAAAAKSANACQTLVRQLLDDAWIWPELPALSLDTPKAHTRPK